MRVAIGMNSLQDLHLQPNDKNTGNNIHLNDFTANFKDADQSFQDDSEKGSNKFPSPGSDLFGVERTT